MIKVGVIEHDSFVRSELVDIIKSSTKLEYILSSESAENFIKYFPSEIDIILININLIGMSGIEAIPKLKRRAPNVQVIMLSAFKENDSIFKAFRAGATGYIITDDSLEEIEETLINVQEGIPALSPAIARRMISFFNRKSQSTQNINLTGREAEVLRLLIDGLSYKLIASEMNNSINSIRYHVKNIYRKLHINSRPELVKLYLDGKIHLPS